MTHPEDTMAQIGRGIELQQRGERAAARMLFTELWSQIGETGDPLHRCALAHWMADVQDDPCDELTWDLRALDAAGSIAEDRAHEAGVAGTVQGFYPSLHLNLAEVYRKLGDHGKATEHLTLGRASVDALGDDAYGKMIEQGLDGLATRLDAAISCAP